MTSLNDRLQYEKKRPLRLKIGTNEKQLSIDDIGDENKLEELRRTIETSSSQIKANLRPVIDWPPRQRFGALSYLASLSKSVRYSIGHQSPTCTKLFDAVLALICDTSDIDRNEQTKRMSIEAAVVCHPGALAGAADRIVKSLNKIGVKGITRAKLRSEAEQLRERIAEETANVECIPIREALPAAPVADQATTPASWRLTTEGILDMAGKLPPVPTPVLIKGRQIDIEDRTESLEVAWMRDGKWDHHTLSRTDASNTQAIIQGLAAYGVPVTSINARTLVQFLCDYETANRAHIPSQSVSHHLGWQGKNGNAGFLVGKKLIGDAERKSTLIFEGRDEGDDQIAQGFHVKGHLEKWLSAIATFQKNDSARLVLYVGFTSPVLSIVSAPNFVLDVAAPTTTGKTTMLRVAASIWGDPDDRNPYSILRSWDSTATFRERAPAVLNSLPLILDDDKLAPRPEDVAKTIYSFAAGAGRGRGSIKGLARSQTWRTVLITSGEQPLTCFSSDGGTRTRVLSLWGSPFGATDSTTGAKVRELNTTMLNNYGHGGPAFVDFLVKNHDQWAIWRKNYRRKIKEYEQLATGNPFAARMAPMLAAICLAAELTHEAIELPWDFSDPIQPVWEELTRNTKEANRALAALRYIKDWANSHQEEFWSIRSTRFQPHGGWAGKWDASSNHSGTNQRSRDCIGFVPSRLEQLLRSGGFESEAIIRAWNDSGWLTTSKDSDGTSRRTIKARMGSVSSRLIAIKRSAWERADEG